jgi:hypothetical protein
MKVFLLVGGLVLLGLFAMVYAAADEFKNCVDGVCTLKQ